ncbi:type IV prepilin-like protein leader peptide processing enzyme [Candidatus Magnetoovum chiemensis]|nr:type IV prepilin-like protein leader peptide processing enzyme [Candidatus Magnetoovum chiemensis]
MAAFYLIGFLIVFAFGLIVGSFLNVCIYRLPRNMSIVSPRSRCIACGSYIKFYHNVPLISYLLLKGKCPNCGVKISFRYPFVEFLNAILYVLLLYRFGFEPYVFMYMLLVSALIVITFIDIDFQIIPHSITLPGIIIGIIASFLILPDPYTNNGLLGLKGSLIGFALGFGVFYSIIVISKLILGKEGMGGGDVMLMAMAGAFLGWKHVLLITFIGSLVGSLFGVLFILIKHKDRKQEIPFGPYLSFGIIISLFFGKDIINLYLNGFDV